MKKKEQTSADTENTSGEKTKLVFLRSGTEPERKAYWEKMIAGFEKENPNIEIEFQECPYGDDFETKLNTGFASGTAPDIINFTMLLWEPEYLLASMLHWMSMWTNGMEKTILWRMPESWKSQR